MTKRMTREFDVCMIHNLLSKRTKQCAGLAAVGLQPPSPWLA